jgi:hypothetical protein
MLQQNTYAEGSEDICASAYQLKWHAVPLPSARMAMLQKQLVTRAGTELLLPEEN